MDDWPELSNNGSSTDARLALETEIRTFEEQIAKLPRRHGMQEQVRIPIETLRRATQLLLDHVESTEGSTVSLEKDYFWAIDPEQLYNFKDQPSSLTIGQLSESLANLERIVDDPSRATSYALAWVADLVRALGQTIVR